MWYVYILKCKDKTFYTGVTNDIARRVNEHNNSKLGAKYTRGRRPVELVYFKTKRNKSYAQKEEGIIKKLNRAEKINLIDNKKDEKYKNKLA